LLGVVGGPQEVHLHPASTPQLKKKTQGKAEPKAKEHRVVGKDDDVIVIEDTSDDKDEEMLQ
jgi:hypothetical protein